MKSLPVLDARCVIFQCKATPEFYKPCNCLFVCHSHIIFLKSASRISTLYGTKCDVSQYKSIVRMLPAFCPDRQSHAPSLFCHPGKSSGFLQIQKNQKRLLLVFTLMLSEGPCPVPTEGRESTDLTSLILLSKIPFQNWRI